MCKANTTSEIHKCFDDRVNSQAHRRRRRVTNNNVRVDGQKAREKARRIETKTSSGTRAGFAGDGKRKDASRQRGFVHNPKKLNGNAEKRKEGQSKGKQAIS